MEIEWITIPELADRIGISKYAVYRQARLNTIPGLVRMGKRIVVNWNHFVEVSKAPITPAA